MKESTTYQAIKEEGRQEGRQEAREEEREKGRLEEVRDGIRRLGERKYRISLPTHFRASLESIHELQKLQRLLELILDAESWEELVPAPTAQRPARQKKK